MKLKKIYIFVPKANERYKLKIITMCIWGFSRDIMQERGALYTSTEIYGQPALWRKVYDKIRSEKQAVQDFLHEALANEKLQIVLTGAGSSAFICLSLHGVFLRHFKNNISTISTTDIVTHPYDYLSRDMPVLLVSFARSGNSPESVAAATIADQVCIKVYHLIITCDPAGELANYQTNSQKYVFMLPTEANDQSLAMTGSYSGMMLAGLLIARLDEIDQLESQILLLQGYASKLLNKYATDFKEIAKMDFHRAVFLGSGPLYGTATESHLKLQELTDGKVICKKDSFLGFRHGPKAVIDGKTLVFFLFSNEPYVQQYERDLAVSVIKSKKALYVTGLMETDITIPGMDKIFELADGESRLQGDFLPICNIIPGQMLGFFKSLQLGLSPDSPSVGGAISRVVKGVIAYHFENQLQ